MKYVMIAALLAGAVAHAQRAPVILNPPSHAAAVESKDAGHEIDFTQTLVGPTGQTILGEDKKTPATLSDIAVIALTSSIEGDNRLTALQKYKLGALAQKIFDNKHAQLSVEEIAILKDRIGHGYGAAVVFSAFNILDPNDK